MNKLHFSTHQSLWDVIINVGVEGRRKRGRSLGGFRGERGVYFSAGGVRVRVCRLVTTGTPSIVTPTGGRGGGGEEEREEGRWMEGLREGKGERRGEESRR